MRPLHEPVRDPVLVTLRVTIHYWFSSREGNYFELSKRPLQPLPLVVAMPALRRPSESLTPRRGQPM